MRVAAATVVLLVSMLAGCFGGSGGQGDPAEDASTDDPVTLLPPDALHFEFGPTAGCIDETLAEGPECVSFVQGPDADPVDGVWLPLNESYWGHAFTSTIDSANGDSDCYFVADDAETILGDAFNAAGPCLGVVPRMTAYLFLYSYMAPSDGMTVTFQAAPVQDLIQDASTGATSWTPCEHPYPCGDEWPEDLEGPFEVREIRDIEIESHDGTILRGWLVLPTTPEDLQLGTVLHLTPYVRLEHDAPPDPSWMTEAGHGAFGRLVEAGYAVAVVNVRGSGTSDGCNDRLGESNQKDAPVVIEHLASQPWSNGRVGMMGLSWPGTTPLHGFISNTTALKAIVVAAGVADEYLTWSTPQGLGWKAFPQIRTPVVAASHPRQQDSTDPAALVGYAQSAPSRVCDADHYREDIAAGIGAFGDDRDADYWDERRLTDRFSQGSAAVMTTQGFHDSVLVFANDHLWPLLEDRPRHMVKGPWHHAFPDRYDAISLEAWVRHITTWFDFWLRGIGDEPPFVETVAYYDALRHEQHLSAAWPPAEAREEVAYLGPDSIDPAPPNSGPSFVSASMPGVSLDHSLGGLGLELLDLYHEFLCQPGPSHATLWSQPVEETTLVAGNPMAYVAVASTRPAGQFLLDLIAVGPDFDCDEQPQSAPVDLLSFGGADLQFHAGNMVARDFPVDAPTMVRVDLHSTAARLEPGDRLALLAWSGDWAERTGQPDAPTLTFHTDGDIPSHIVLPFVEGTLGGEETTYDYPPRPFMPGGT